MEITGRKTYRGRTMAQAMIEMKRELGHDALLISHHKVKRGGLFGIGAKEFVEVVGEKLPPWMGRNRGVEPRLPGALVKRAPAKGAIRRPGSSWISEEPALPALVDYSSGAFDDDLIVKDVSGRRNRSGYTLPAIQSKARVPERSRVAVRREPVLPVAVRAAAFVEEDEAGDDEDRGMEMDDLRSQMQELQAVVQAFMKNEAPAPRIPSSVDNSVGRARKPAPVMREDHSDQAAAPLDEISTAVAPVVEADGFSGILESMHQRLKDSGVPDEMAWTIVDRVAQRTDVRELDDSAVLRARVAKEIATMVRIAPPLDPNPDVPLIIVCVGATGVGKTTTLAKLGALFADEEARSIAFITLDRYRIAAAEQLRTYSDILNVPFEEAASAEELADAVERHIDKEVILIDTAGRSPYHAEAIQELKVILDNLRIETELLLLVSSATDPREIKTVIGNFALSDRVRLVFTKVDEISCWGSIFAAAVESKIPVAFWTTGQSVPDDIEPAEAMKFAEALLRTREQEPTAKASGRENRDSFVSLSPSLS
ncbi:MAG: AAA family ATPase [Candidatus Hydrogenedentota bacterium]